MDYIKVFVVGCGECGEKQIWDSGVKYKECGTCDSVVVLRTSSPTDLQMVKKSVDPESRMVFSNYMVYSLYPGDVERVVTERRAREKIEKQEVQQRRMSASMPARTRGRKA